MNYVDTTILSRYVDYLILLLFERRGATFSRMGSNATPIPAIPETVRYSRHLGGRSSAFPRHAAMIEPTPPIMENVAKHRRMMFPISIFRWWYSDRVETTDYRPPLLPHHRTCGFPHPAVGSGELSPRVPMATHGTH
uniref:Uncharacterized protein n=1 Tax=Candidatus Kentrum sp. TC TaxID=2126339 RepID=A0A450YA10_9GAMM|nr:MAG: hypothetical protein BECKTC1821D_GA0114238_100438 [Candidatus Kentron sp. TC]